MDNYEDTGGSTPATGFGDVVARVDSQGDDVHSLTQATSSQRPTIILTPEVDPLVWQFQGGNDDALAGAFGGGSLSQPHTTLTFFNQSFTSVVYDRVIQAEGPTNFSRASLNWGIHNGVFLGSGTATDTDWHLLAVVANGANSKFWLDGGAPLASGDSGTNTSSGFTLGNRFDQAVGLDGEIGEFLRYPARLSIDDINTVASYLSDLSGLAWTTATES